MAALGFCASVALPPVAYLARGVLLHLTSRVVGAAKNPSRSEIGEPSSICTGPIGQQGQSKPSVSWAPDWMNFGLVNSPSCGANIRGDFGHAFFAADAELISMGRGAVRPSSNLWRPKRNRSHQSTLEVTQNRIVLASIATGSKGVLVGAPPALELEELLLL
jgi:hypothetical protein